MQWQLLVENMKEAELYPEEMAIDNVGFLLGKSDQIKDRLLEQHLLPEDITATQAKVLFQIYKFHLFRPSEVGKSLNVDNSAITRMLDRLEKKALLKRIQDPNDRRSILVNLTVKGEQVVQRALPLAMDAINELTAPLSDEEVAQLRHCLKKIITAALPESCRDKFMKGTKS